MSKLCDHCGKGIMYLKTVPYYSTEIDKTPIVVRDAHFLQCDICDEIVIDKAELRKWKRTAYCVKEWQKIAKGSRDLWK